MLPYQLGPGIIRILSFAPPYCWSKPLVNTLWAGRTPDVISGSRSFAISVQCESSELMTSFFPCSCSSGHLLAQR